MDTPLHRHRAFTHPLMIAGVLCGIFAIAGAINQGLSLLEKLELEIWLVCVFLGTWRFAVRNVRYLQRKEQQGTADGEVEQILYRYAMLVPAIGVPPLFILLR